MLRYGLALGIGVTAAVVTSSLVDNGSSGGSVAPGAPNTPTISTNVFAPTEDSLRLVLSDFVGSGGDTQDSVQFQVDTAGTGAWSGAKFSSSLGAVVTDTATSLQPDAVLKVRGRVKGAQGGWSNWSDSSLVTMTYSAWPNNEPVGMTLITSTDGSDKYFGTGGSGTGWFFGGRWNNATYVNEDISCSGSRYGTCITKMLEVGDLAGWQGLAQYIWTSTAGRKRHVYFRTITKYSSNYQVCGANEKPYGYLAYNTDRPGAAVNDLFMSHNGGTDAWHIANQGGGWSDHFFSPGFTWSADTWITTEIHAVGESTTSASDGELYVWIDGTQVEFQTGVDWGSNTSTWYGMSLFNYWGGQSCTKTVQDTIFISEVYVSGKN